MTDKQPKKHKTSDGREFDDRGDAERHEAQITIRREALEAAHHAWSAAETAYRQRLAETQKTLDGELFIFDILVDYYYIDDGWHGLPKLYTVCFNANLRNIAVDNQGRLCIFTADHTGRERGFPLGTLYKDKALAQRMCLKAMKEWLAAREKDIEKYRLELVAEGVLQPFGQG